MRAALAEFGLRAGNGQFNAQNEERVTAYNCLQFYLRIFLYILCDKNVFGTTGKGYKAWHSQRRLRYPHFFKTIFTKWIVNVTYVSMNTDHKFSELLRRFVSVLLAKGLNMLSYFKFLCRRHDTVSRATCFSRSTGWARILHVSFFLFFFLLMWRFRTFSAHGLPVAGVSRQLGIYKTTSSPTTNPQRRGCVLLTRY